MRFLSKAVVVAIGAGLVLGPSFYFRDVSSASNSSAPPGMVWIPPGQFTMGTDDPKSFPNERPAHRVKLDGFWIDVNDVANAGRFAVNRCDLDEDQLAKTFDGNVLRFTGQSTRRQPLNEMMLGKE